MDAKITVMTVTLVVYFLILMGIAYWSLRSSRVGLEDFFLMGRQVGTVLGAFSLAATLLSAFTFLGMAGTAYFVGPSLAMMFFVLPPLMCIGFMWVAPTLWALGKKYQLITPGDYFELRFGGWQGKVLRQMATWFFILITLVPSLMVQLTGGGYAFQSLFGWPYLAGVALVAIVIAIYTCVGGFRADILTDLFQGAVMLIMLWFIAIWIVGAAGGLPAVFQTFVANNPAQAATNSGFFTSTMWISFGIMFAFSIFWRPDFMSRMYAIKDKSTIRKLAWLFPIVMILVEIPGALLLGLSGKVIFEKLPAGTSPDNIVLMLIDKFIPAWIAGLLVAGLLAAIMSTADSQLIASSSMFCRDFLQRIKRDMSEGALVNWGRVFMVVMVIVAFIMASNPAPLMVELEGIMTSVILQFAPVVMLSLFWRRMSATAAVVALPVGVILATAGVLGGKQLTLMPPLQLTPAIYALIATTVVCVAVSLFTTEPATKVKKDLFGEEVEVQEAARRVGAVPGTG